jgi:heme oxygenase
VILKNITGALGHNADSGAAYFSGYGNKTGSHWKTFLDALLQFETENNAGEEIIAGANFAFEAIHAHFKNGAN